VRLRRALLALNRQERGQILILVAGGIVAILGLVALTTDIGIFLHDIRDAQNDADAAALAGAQAFMLKPPDGAAAIQLAEEWAANNGADGQVVWNGDGACAKTPSGTTVPWGVSDSNADGEPDTICLAIERSTPSVFARVLGISSFALERRAAARAVNADHGAACPWALESTEPSDTDGSDGTYLGVEMGKIYAVKVGAGQSGWGNFGILRLYPESCGPGGGTACYTELVESGCDANSFNVFTQGDTILTSTEPGNVGNPTMNALEAYYNYELNDGISDGEGFGWCDVPMNWDAETELGVPSGYDPAVPPGPREGCATDAHNGRSGRYILIPIVDGFPPSGSGNIKILALATVYVTGWGEWNSGSGTYNRHAPPGHANLYVEFVEQAPLKPKDLMGVSDNPLAPLRIMLIR
jgi:hypothetical protein